MLRTLRIRDLAIIEDLTAEFGPGLNLLTGETGAGKSILVDALGVVTGARADRGLVRTGAERAIVEAAFELPPGNGTLLECLERGVDGVEDGQLVVRREIAASGAGRVLLNGSPSTLAVLRELGEGLLELHGQHEHQSLLAPRRHLELLDAFGGHADLLDRLRRAHAAWSGASERLLALKAKAGDAADLAARLSETTREIQALRPRPGEMEEIERDRRVLRHAGRMVQLLEEAVELCYEGESSAAARAAAAARLSGELASLDPTLTELAARLEAAAVELGDAGASLRDYRERADFEPGRLEALETRRAALERACRRHATDEAGLLELAARSAVELSALRDLEGDLETGAAELARAEGAYAEAAIALGRARREAGLRLVPAVEAQLAELALAQAKLGVAFMPVTGPNPGGAERAELLLAANPGEPLQPLAQVASGGELSRVMLALHVVADTEGAAGVLVFDEVDAGVGGAVADAVGARLSRLARRHQILCVTHLPQIAAYADRHLRVHKRVSGGRTRAGIACLAEEGRVEELARMLAGRRPTPASRQHASELLAAAGRAGTPSPRRRA